MPFWAGLLTEEHHPHDELVSAVRQASWDLYFRANRVCEPPEFVEDPGMDLASLLDGQPILVLKREVSPAQSRSKRSSTNSAGEFESVFEHMKAIRTQTRQSLVNIRKASRLLQGKEYRAFGTRNVENGAKSCVRKINRETGLSFRQIEDLLTSTDWDMKDGDEDILTRFQNLRIWRRREVRAPYKPMLAIWAIGRCMNGKPRMAPFDTAHAELTGLIQRFGPHRGSVPTEQPFWRLQNDGVWEIDKPHLVRVDSSGGPSVPSLYEHGIRGGLIESYYEAFQDDPNLAWRVALSLLEAHFPASLHGDILHAAGFHNLPLWTTTRWWTSPIRRRRRDGAFRARVLDAYDDRCAVCELSLELREHSVGLEAAHIHWHAYGGSSESVMVWRSACSITSSSIWVHSL